MGRVNWVNMGWFELMGEVFQCRSQSGGIRGIGEPALGREEVNTVAFAFTPGGGAVDAVVAVFEHGWANIPSNFAVVTVG